MQWPLMDKMVIKTRMAFMLSTMFCFKVIYPTTTIAYSVSWWNTKMCLNNCLHTRFNVSKRKNFSLYGLKWTDAWGVGKEIQTHYNMLTNVIRSMHRLRKWDSLCSQTLYGQCTVWILLKEVYYFYLNKKIPIKIFFY